MRTVQAEIIDLALSQALERYLEMEPDEIYDAMVAEWPPQMAVLLTEFFFKTTCGGARGVPSLQQLKRADTDMTFFVPVCTCTFAFGGIHE